MYMLILFESLHIKIINMNKMKVVRYMKILNLCYVVNNLKR